MMPMEPRVRMTEVIKTFVQDWVQGKDVVPRACMHPPSVVDRRPQSRENRSGCPSRHTGMTSTAPVECHYRQGQRNLHLSRACFCARLILAVSGVRRPWTSPHADIQKAAAAMQMYERATAAHMLGARDRANSLPHHARTRQRQRDDCCGGSRNRGQPPALWCERAGRTR